MKERFMTLSIPYTFPSSKLLLVRNYTYISLLAKRILLKYLFMVYEQLIRGMFWPTLTFATFYKNLRTSDALENISNIHIMSYLRKKSSFPSNIFFNQLTKKKLFTAPCGGSNPDLILMHIGII